MTLPKTLERSTNITARGIGCETEAGVCLTTMVHQPGAAGRQSGEPRFLGFAIQGNGEHPGRGRSDHCFKSSELWGSGVVALPIKRPVRFLAWSEAFSWPVIGKAIRLLGAWPLQVEGSDPSAIRRSLTWLREGGVVVIFPEGGRGKPDGSLIRMKGGAVRIALEAGVPILPVTIRGAHRVWPAGQRVPRTGKVEIIYHPIIRVQQLPGEETRACARRETERLSAIIESGLA